MMAVTIGRESKKPTKKENRESRSSQRTEANENERRDRESEGNTLEDSFVYSAGQLHINTGMSYGSSSHS